MQSWSSHVYNTKLTQLEFQSLTSNVNVRSIFFLENACCTGVFCTKTIGQVTPATPTNSIVTDFRRSIIIREAFTWTTLHIYIVLSTRFSPLHIFWAILGDLWQKEQPSMQKCFAISTTNCSTKNSFSISSKFLPNIIYMNN